MSIKVNLNDLSQIPRNILISVAHGFLNDVLTFPLIVPSSLYSVPLFHLPHLLTYLAGIAINRNVLAFVTQPTAL